MHSKDAYSKLVCDVFLDAGNFSEEAFKRMNDFNAQGEDLYPGYMAGRCQDLAVDTLDEGGVPEEVQAHSNSNGKDGHSYNLPVLA